MPELPGHDVVVEAELLETGLSIRLLRRPAFQFARRPHACHMAKAVVVSGLSR